MSVRVVPQLVEGHGGEEAAAVEAACGARVAELVR